jgi:hypothetical protein
MTNSKQNLSAIALAAFLAGCGGGGGSSPPATSVPAATPATGVMVDGYISGATVFCDTNDNGIQDAGEASIVTGSAGAYNLAAGCNFALVGTGGTNVDTGFAFTGKLKAPSGSTAITPLTTLVTGTTLTPAALAVQLGLPVGTDVTKIDPADGSHQDLLKKTLAVQQLVNETVKILLASSGSADAASQYARVAAGFSTSLAGAAAGTTLISSTGVINTALVTSAVMALPDVVALKISNANVSAAVSSIAAEAQSFAQSTDANLANLTSTLQNPTKPTITASQTSNYLSLDTSGLLINGVSAAIGGSSLSSTGLSSIGFDLGVAGTPPAMTETAVALELVEVAGASSKGRTLKLMIDKVDVSVTNGAVSVAVPAGAKVYVYGVAANGTQINMTLADLSFTPIMVQDNGFSLNYTNMVNKVLASADNTSKVTAQSFVGIKGTFALKVALSTLNLRKVDASALTVETISLDNTTQSVTGSGLAGTITIN